MHKYLVFDLDGTLAPFSDRALPETIDLLNVLVDMGYKFGICSGKSADFASGFARQLHVKEPFLITENGSNIWYDCTYPPKKVIENNPTDEELAELNHIRKTIKEHFGEKIFIQPNRFVVNPFPLDDSIEPELDALIQSLLAESPHIWAMKHVDCYDILAKTVTKQTGLKRFADEEGASSSDFICVGDSMNDVPMFKFADVSIGVTELVRPYATYTFNNIIEVLKFIRDNRL